VKVGFINRSTGIRNDEFRNAVSAFNSQARRDFGPAWSIKASAVALPRNFTESLDRVDAIIYIDDKPKKDDGTLGYHDKRTTGMPFGICYHEISDSLGEPWTVTASHELCELLLNPWIGSYEYGPHPENPQKMVFHWREACDAVQSQQYTIKNKNGSRVAVSDFVLPLYFTVEAEAPGPGRYKANDWLESRLKSFGVLKGGYVGYFDPRTGREGTVFANREAERRHRIKSAAGLARRKMRMSQALELLNSRPRKTG
jgi:hypothetical protein